MANDREIECSSSYDEDSDTLSSSSSLHQSSGLDTITSPSFSDLSTFSSSSGSDSSCFPPPPSPMYMTTYKLVGDNIDKDVRPRDMRSDYQTRSMHYFHSYAVKDRVDLSCMSDQAITPSMDVNFEELLPSKNDMNAIRKNITVLFARVLRKYIPFFDNYGKGVERHIHHEFSAEMSRKSEIVCTKLLE